MAALGTHPNSLANLAPPFGQNGDTRGAAGRPPNAGASIIEWMNTMGLWPEARIEAVADDEKAAVTKRQAAKSLLRSLNDEYAKNGRPFAADDLDRVLDRCHGKSVQRVAVARVDARDPSLVRAEFMAALADLPELRKALLGEGSGDGVGAPKEA